MASRHVTIGPARGRRAPVTVVVVLNYDDMPRLVFWEMTGACPLACVHCRASAQPVALPGELTTTEGRALVDELAAGPRPHPVLILTGGDCLSRADLLDIVAHAQDRGVPVALAPAVSDRLTPALLDALYRLGVRSVSLSLDGACAETHERIRQVPGHFDATLAAMRMLVERGYSLQINTAVMTANVEELADIAALAVREGVKAWEVFFLVNVGRGDAVADVTPEQAEDICHLLVDAARYTMIVRTVEAPFFRRVASERADAAFDPLTRGALYRRLASRLAEQLGPPRARVLAPTSATRDGKGIIFVSRDGTVYPSGFLPLAMGTLRDEPLLQIYRNHPLLRDIRASRFDGRCGTCDYRDLCGGSRSRAFAAFGDPLADDPSCILVNA